MSAWWIETGSRTRRNHLCLICVGERVVSWRDKSASPHRKSSAHELCCEKSVDGADDTYGGVLTAFIRGRRERIPHRLPPCCCCRCCCGTDSLWQSPKPLITICLVWSCCLFDADRSGQRCFCPVSGFYI